jgi:ATP-dependent helicase HrpA
VFGAYTGAVCSFRDSKTPTISVTYDTPDLNFAAVVTETTTERLRVMLQTLGPQSSAGKRHALEELAWMIEEYNVSIFAQELKTVGPMSPKRLEEKIGEIERMA